MTAREGTVKLFRASRGTGCAPGCRRRDGGHTVMADEQDRTVVMSLTVSAELLEQAGNGEVDDEQFVACVRTSLPYA